MDIEYNGYDVYSDVISFLTSEYNKPKFNFSHLDIFKDRNSIKNADLFIIKDVIQHWDDAATEELHVGTTAIGIEGFNCGDSLDAKMRAWFK